MVFVFHLFVVDSMVREAGFWSGDHVSLREALPRASGPWMPGDLAMRPPLDCVPVGMDTRNGLLASQAVTLLWGSGELGGKGCSEREAAAFFFNFSAFGEKSLKLYIGSIPFQKTMLFYLTPHKYHQNLRFLIIFTIHSFGSSVRLEGKVGDFSFWVIFCLNVCFYFSITQREQLIYFLVVRLEVYFPSQWNILSYENSLKEICIR